jgi:hypothetical protein
MYFSFMDFKQRLGIAWEWRGRRYSRSFRMPWIWRAYRNWKFHRTHPGI